MITTLTTLAAAAADDPLMVEDFGLPQIIALILLPVLAIGLAGWGTWVVARDAPEA